MVDPLEKTTALFRIGKYQVRKQLGKGATGTVYLAVDGFSGEEVALKTIDPEIFKDPEFGSIFRTQFENEASLAGKLRHPHIIGILDAVVEENSGHIAMELVTGGDLTQHVKPETVLPVSDVLQIGFKCCGALDYAFQEGIFHRDIKPANIMIAADTGVKIADFGAAFLRRKQASQEVAMGSPYYMPPEQVEGKDLTYHSDMYSLGVVLYELLTGRRPYTANSMEMLIEKIVSQTPEAPSLFRPEILPAIDAVVLKAMAKAPADRYDSWSDFAHDLAEVAKLVAPPDGISDSEKYMALKRCEMLADLSDAQMWELARAGRWTRAPKGAIVVRENEEGDSFFFLAKGSVKVRRDGKILNVVRETECFGEMAYIRNGDIPRYASVEAMNELLLAEFRPLVVMQVSADAQIHLMRALIRNVVDRLELANSRL